MKALLEEFSDIILSVICGLLSLSVFLSFVQAALAGNESLYRKTEPLVMLADYRPAEIAVFEAEDQYFPQGSEFVLADWVRAQNGYGEDLLAYVSCDKVFDTQNCGSYELVYSIYYHGEYQSKQVTYYVL